MNRRSFKYQKGVSLVEILIVLSIVGVLALLIASLPNAISSITKSRSRSNAKNIANKQINLLRQIGYANLTNGESAFTDSDLSTMLNPHAKYQVEDCPMTICQSGELLKQVKVIVDWSENNTKQQVELITLVGTGGVGQ